MKKATNTHTQAEIDKSHAIVKAMCLAANISAEQWLMLMFETGCQVAEKNEPDEAVRRYLLQDASYGFWAWWVGVYVAHDEYLLQQPVTNYQLHKQNMQAIMCIPEKQLATNILTAK